MTLEISVGTPQLAIHQGWAVYLTEPDGQVREGTQRGLLFRDTRLVSTWRLFANGLPWEVLNGGAVAHYAMQVFLTNPAIPADHGEISQRTLSLVLRRWMDGGVHEDLDVTNHGPAPVTFNLELMVQSDFADLFEIKADRPVRRGRVVGNWSEREQTLHVEYRNGGFRRALAVRVHAQAPASFANGCLSFSVAVRPGETWHACLLTDLIDDGHVLRAPEGCAKEARASQSAQALAEWHRSGTTLQTANPEFQRFYDQGVDDLAGLRMPVAGTDEHDAVPAAGLPWFAALFGRDSLIVAMQAAPVTLAFARGALIELGRWQAQVRDDERDAEPGKIPHELRLGELAYLRRIPHTPYYGTADATPLYLVLLQRTWRWSGKRALLQRHLATAEACLAWIDNWGDRDGDGFQEYQTRSSRGYENVGWKDAFDAVLYPDGTMVKGPKALCELQGYVYAAWQGMAEIFAALGQESRAAALREKAAALAARFDAAFWDEDFGGYAYALDGEKRRVLTSVSNVGHLLWSGIVPKERAARVVARLLAPDMFSGWGVRTLSTAHPAFNPYAYHNGSVWPHDNAIIAQGMAHYGFTAEAARVAEAISRAAGFFAQHQVPELYAGFPAEVAPFPVQVIGANVPQAWAAGSVFSFLAAMLGLDPDAPNGVLRVSPDLPEWLPEVTLRDLRLGPHRLELAFRRRGTATEVAVVAGDPAAVQVHAGSRLGVR
jgi:glycogen debranching enzyme